MREFLWAKVLLIPITIAGRKIDIDLLELGLGSDGESGGTDFGEGGSGVKGAKKPAERGSTYLSTVYTSTAVQM